MARSSSLESTLRPSNRDLVGSKGLFGISKYSSHWYPNVESGSQNLFCRRRGAILAPSRREMPTIAASKALRMRRVLRVALRLCLAILTLWAGKGRSEAAEATAQVLSEGHNSA